jgi:hypothetical protein
MKRDGILPGTECRLHYRLVSKVNTTSATSVKDGTPQFVTQGNALLRRA